MYCLLLYRCYELQRPVSYERCKVRAVPIDSKNEFTEEFLEQ